MFMMNILYITCYQQKKNFQDARVGKQCLQIVLCFKHALKSFYDHTNDPVYLIHSAKGGILTSFLKSIYDDSGAPLGLDTIDPVKTFLFMVLFCFFNNQSQRCGEFARVLDNQLVVCRPNPLAFCTTAAGNVITQVIIYVSFLTFLGLTRFSYR